MLRPIFHFFIGESVKILLFLDLVSLRVPLQGFTFRNEPTGSGIIFEKIVVSLQHEQTHQERTFLIYKHTY